MDDELFELLLATSPNTRGKKKSMHMEKLLLSMLADKQDFVYVLEITKNKSSSRSIYKLGASSFPEYRRKTLAHDLEAFGLRVNLVWESKPTTQAGWVLKVLQQCFVETAITLEGLIDLWKHCKHIPKEDFTKYFGRTETFAITDMDLLKRLTEKLCYYDLEHEIGKVKVELEASLRESSMDVSARSPRKAPRQKKTTTGDEKKPSGDEKKKKKPKP